MRKFLLISLALITFNVNAQITYYVSSSNGNDANPGTSENQPLKTLNKVNALNLKPGDKVLFRRGDIWQGEYLIIKSSGLKNNSILFGAFSNGNKPIITLKHQVPSWKTASWSNVGSNIWCMQINFGYILSRLWINNQEVIQAVSVYGDNLDGSKGVCSTHKFYYDNSNNKLYIYSTSNPINAYSSLECPGSGTTELNVVKIQNANFITIDGLDIQGGLYSSIGIGNSDYVKIINSNVGKYTNFTGISTYGIGAMGTSSDYGIISNNIIDSDWLYNLKFYTNYTPEGIVVGDGATYWDIHDNYIKDWWVSVFVISFSKNGGVSSYHNIYNNEMLNPNFTAFGYPLVLHADTTNKGYQNVNFYNNYCHDFPVGIELASSGNKIFNNIFAHYTQTDNEHDMFHHNGWGLSSFTGSVPNATKPEKNYIFNNTWYDFDDYAYMGWANEEYWYNNLFINVGTSKNNIVIRDCNNAKKTWVNNLFYNSSSNGGSKMITLDAFVPPDSVSYTVSGFNKLNGKYNKVILGNMQYVGPISKLIDTSNFSLPSGSLALNNGVDISSLIDEGINDRLGNVVNRTHPNIGAVSGNAHSSLEFKVFLEGPYKNGEMNIILNNNGLIPKSQPYNISPWNYNGSENVSSIPNNVVDWVLVELRSNASASSVVARKAGLLTKEGNIVGLDGINPLKFDNSLLGNYYVVIKHRNHLAVMSSRPVQLVNFSIQYDFTTSIDKAYGQNSMINLGNGVFGMYGGDTDGNGIIDDKDITDVSLKLFSSGYNEEDADMNTPVNVLDYKLPQMNKLKSTNVQ